MAGETKAPAREDIDGEAPIVDESLVEAALAMSVADRLRQNDRMLRTILRLRQAFADREDPAVRDRTG